MATATVKTEHGLGFGQMDRDLKRKSSPEDMNTPKSKRRRSRKGLEKQYKCDEPDCGKKFTRLEHLYRHQLNHRPKEIYHCPWPGCEKTFVREDLKIRHIERHEKREQGKGRNTKTKATKKLKKEESEPSNTGTTTVKSPLMITQQKLPPLMYSNGPTPSALFFEDPFISDKVEQQLSNQNTTNNIFPFSQHRQFFAASGSALSPPTGFLSQRNSISGPVSNATSVIDTTVNTNTSLSFDIGRPISDLRTTAYTPSLTQNLTQTIVESSTPTFSETVNTVSTNTTVEEKPFSTEPEHGTDLVSWLFSDATLSNAKDPLLSPSFYSFESPMSLQSLLTPPIVQEEITISETKRLEILTIIPQLESHEYCGLPYLERYISKYWACVHPQYPILHKPSFQVDRCPAGLLWAIILLGASLDKAHDFASKIASPLRWALFGSSDFDPPAKLWVIQALVLLELFEKTMSNRKAHERAHIHHATTLQLLRRGSVLRGVEAPREMDPWKRWIESESAKRVALMAFVLDVFDATMFGHAMVMSVHEIRLSLPCSETIWAEFPSDKGTPRFQTISFLAALKRTLNRTHVETGPFGRRVLLAGLLCISIQMQQRDNQVSSLGWGAFRDTWRDTLGPAYHFWKKDYDESVDDDLLNDLQNNYTYVTELRGCTSAFYHLAHMSMYITFLDLQIYSGCPAALNQPIRQADQENSVKKINDWARTSYGRLAYWHAIQFLKEMYLTDKANDKQSLYIATCTCPSPEESDDEQKKPLPLLEEMEKIKYNAYNDPVGKRPNAVYFAGLLIWTFSFCLDGTESNALASTVNSADGQLNGNESTDQSAGIKKFALLSEDISSLVEEESNHIQSAEEGYHYLHRLAGYSPDDIGNAPFKNRVVGLLRMINSSLRYHHAELVQEGRRLLVHCVDRSLGRNKVRCEYMFSPRSNRA